MTKRLLLLLFICLCNVLKAQDSKGNDYYFGENFMFEGISTDERMLVRQSFSYQTSDQQVWRVFEYFDNSKTIPGKSMDIQPKSPIMLGIKLNHKLKNYFSAEIQNFSKHYNSYLIPDSSDAIIIALGINKDNIHQFHYRVVENDSIELVRWSPIPALEMKYGAKVPYGAIGTFNYPNKQILVEVAHKDQYGIRDGYIIDWRERTRPVLKQIVARGVGKYGYYNLRYDSLNNGYVSQFDKISGAPLDWAFPKDSVTSFTLEFEPHETTPYSIYLIKKTENKVDTSQIEWWTQDQRYDINYEHLSQVGEYELLIHTTGRFGTSPESEILRIPYTVKHPALGEKKYTLKSLLPYLLGFIGLTTGAFLLYRRASRKKIKKIEQQKQSAGIQLKNIQAQLNPHFMFNAISSIQNLMQKNDLESANHYLHKFASLTRATLVNAEQEMSSLSNELKLLDDYLQMEQLRFGFHYEIINRVPVHGDLIEIPTMLWQPFVENAVKHGIASLYEKGNIQIKLIQNKADLLIYISDNGRGFTSNPEQTNSGYGIRLSKERIDLLNRIYEDQPFHLEINFSDAGTVILISISNWMATN